MVSKSNILTHEVPIIYELINGVNNKSLLAKWNFLKINYTCRYTYKNSKRTNHHKLFTAFSHGDIILHVQWMKEGNKNRRMGFYNMNFWAHLSWKLKWAFLIVFSVCPSVCKLFTISSSPEPLSQFQPNLTQSSIGWWVFKSSNEKPHPFPRGDNYKIAKLYWQDLKIIFSKTTGPI